MTDHSRISKFLSYVLRHHPESIGITLDSEGWTDIGLLVAATTASGKTLDRALLLQVVETSDKKRYTVSSDGLRIRAAQGHSSTSVDIRYVAQTPPAVLYHGTASRFVAAIASAGLKPGSRQYVHLSLDQATAVAVGQRHGKPVVLQVDALRMHEQGHVFYLTENAVWLTAGVPPAFILAPRNTPSAAGGRS